MQLTKQQRLDAYTYVLFMVMSDTTNLHINSLFKDFMFLRFDVLLYICDAVDLFPEITFQDKLRYKRFKTEKRRKKQSMDILEKAIALCEQAKD